MIVNITNFFTEYYAEKKYLGIYIFLLVNFFVNIYTVSIAYFVIIILNENNKMTLQ